MSQGVAGELFISYSRGWRDGACSRPKRPEFVEHKTRPDLRDAYLRGYDVGHAAYNRDLSAYAGEVGYDIAKGIIDR
jgi:hypothetical protein